jgi:thiol-disulfide isomerase/thioredoxin
VVRCGCEAAYLLNPRREKHIKFATELLFVVAGSPRINLSATAATIPKNMSIRKSEKMSKVDVEFELDGMVKNKKKVFVLFYASWCPFSQRFLPIFEKYSQNSSQECIRVKTDDKAKLCEKYLIDTVPTVLLFELGTVTQRLDGEPGAGLSEQQLKKMLTES